MLWENLIELKQLESLRSEIPPPPQALTTPLAWLPGIARNDCRATEFVGRSCPPNLYFENLGNMRTAAHNTLYALSILRGILRSDCHVQSISVHDLNDIISTVFRLIMIS